MAMDSRSFFGKYIAAVALALLCGCASYDSPFVHKTEEELDLMETTDACAAMYFAAGDYATADSIVKPLCAEPTVSRPLYDLERVSVKLLTGERDEAHELMMAVRSDLELLNDIHAEKQAASLWHGENKKVFHGDAHEKATLYALLAMSFMEKAEWEDAERCVKNGLLADSTNTKNVQYNSDYALLQYLGYVICRKTGRDDDAAEYEREFRMVYSGLKLSGDGKSIENLFDPANVPDSFIVVWTGTPPSYARGGEYEEIRHVIPGGTVFSCITLDKGDGRECIMPYGLADINFQATTRGGRRMDSVLANKAAIKTGMAASGNILLLVGYSCFLSMGGDNYHAALALGIVGATCITLGITAHVVGALVNSKADVRYWKNLPGEMMVFPLKVGDGCDVTLRAYKTYDNILRKQLRLVGGVGDGIRTTHYSIMPYNKIANPVSEQLKRAVDSVGECPPSRFAPAEIPFTDPPEE